MYDIVFVLKDFKIVSEFAIFKKFCIQNLHA